MPNKIERKSHNINASGKIAGRLASQVASLLIGKNKADFTPQYDMGDAVVISNITEIKFTGNKLADKKYYKHTGYIGNMKVTKLSDWLEKKPEALFKKMVRNMLPDNRLRANRLKRLTFKQ
ncbi:MAG: 50S ribosomal protein L13 [Candidatus Komeilibacteria bacterium]